jgi:hypothetical protein
MPRAYVYIIRPRGRQKPIKVGHATNLKQRLSTLQSQSPKFLEFVAAIAFLNKAHARFFEQATHEAFKEYQVHGEWLMIEPREALQFIEDAARARNIMFLKNIPSTRPKRLHRAITNSLLKSNR